jgi:Fe2+ or Zn2+ uptake regulation protein
LYFAFEILTTPFSFAILEKHSHLICRNCGVVIDFPDIDISDKLTSLAGDFEPEEVAITIRGFCKSCLAH